MSAIANGSLQPTWTGHVATARDALVLFEACLNGTLHHVPRRPHDRERQNLIRSGSVFIYEENASGIKRWTDGVPWSPSRILGNFLVYRELSKPFPPGEKKRATKKNNRPARATKPGEPYPRHGSTGSPNSPTTPSSSSHATEQNSEAREAERSLIGSLVDSYGFKDGGLVKKTMSVQVHGVHHHLVSYYTMDDAMYAKLRTVAQDQRLINIEPRHDLIARQSFRAPLDENVEDGYPDVSGGHPGSYYAHSGYVLNNSAPMNLGYTSMAVAAPPVYAASIPNYTAVTQSYTYPTAAANVPPLYSHYNGTGYSHNNSGYSNNNVNRPPLSISTDRRSSYNQQPSYSYRQPSTPQSARPALEAISQVTDGRTMDLNSWGGSNRMVTSAGQNGAYTATAPVQPHSAGPFSTGHNPWNSTVPPQGLPRMESAWSSADNQWGLDHSSGGRHSAYSSAQHNV